MKHEYIFFGFDQTNAFYLLLTIIFMTSDCNLRLMPKLALSAPEKKKLIGRVSVDLNLSNIFFPW